RARARFGARGAARRRPVRGARRADRRRRGPRRALDRRLRAVRRGARGRGRDRRGRAALAGRARPRGLVGRGFVQRRSPRLSAVHAARGGRRHARAGGAARRRPRRCAPLEIEAVARAHVVEAPAAARGTGAHAGGGGAARGVQTGARGPLTAQAARRVGPPGRPRELRRTEKPSGSRAGTGSRAARAPERLIWRAECRRRFESRGVTIAKVIEEIEREQLKKDIPSFAPGDTVVVQVRVTEGDRERLQAYEGVVIAKRNRGLNSSFTVRKISHGEGVERVFQTHSPAIAEIKVKRRGDVRRAKLYYLRDRSGKSARIKEKV